MTSCDRVEAEPGPGEVTAVPPRPDARSRVSPEAPEATGLVTPDGPEASSPPGPSAASTDSSLGARHKTTLSKEKKLTGKHTVLSVLLLLLPLASLFLSSYRPPH